MNFVYNIFKDIIINFSLCYNINMAKQDLIIPDSGLSDKELKFGYFFVKHKLLFKKIFFALFIIFDIYLIGYAGYGYIKYYFIEQNSPSVFTDFKIKQHPPSKIKVLNSQVIFLGKQRYDLFSLVNNQNSDWVINFDYYFIFPGGQTDAKKGFILPNETKFLSELGFKSSRRPRQISLHIENMSWKRLNKHQIPDYNDFYKKHLNFKISNIEFHSAQELALDTISRVNFNIKNNTAYSYWNVGLYVVLYRGSKIVGINHLILDKFLSGEEKDVDVAFYEKLPLVNKVKVVPDLNILDQNVYMKIEAGSGEAK